MIAHVDEVVQSSLDVAFSVALKSLVNPTVEIDVGSDANS